MINYILTSKKEQSIIGKAFFCLFQGERTSLDAFAYIWKEPKNCVFIFLNRFLAKMMRNIDTGILVKPTPETGTIHNAG